MGVGGFSASPISVHHRHFLELFVAIGELFAGYQSRTIQILLFRTSKQEEGQTLTDSSLSMLISLARSLHIKGPWTNQCKSVSIVSWERGADTG